MRSHQAVVAGIPVSAVVGALPRAGPGKWMGMAPASPAVPGRPSANAFGSSNAWNFNFNNGNQNNNNQNNNNRAWAVHSGA